MILITYLSSLFEKVLASAILLKIQILYFEHSRANLYLTLTIVDSGVLLDLSRTHLDWHLTGETQRIGMLYSAGFSALLEHRYCTLILTSIIIVLNSI